jgi:hypothetical protein
MEFELPLELVRVAEEVVRQKVFWLRPPSAA